MIAVRNHLDRLGDTLPVVVTFTDRRYLAEYRTHLAIDFPIVADTDLGLYRALGIGRGSLRQVWSPGTMAMYAQLLRRGRRLRRPVDDTRQLGADALVDRNGTLARVWRPSSPDARPPVAELIDAADDLDR